MTNLTEEKIFKLLEKQVAHTVAAAGAFRELTLHWKLKSPVFETLPGIEHEADDAAEELKATLDCAYATCREREDIHILASQLNDVSQLADELDDIVDIIHALARRMNFYGIEAANEYLIDLAEILAQAAEGLQKAVRDLSKPQNARALLAACEQVYRLEGEGDQVFGAALGKLFKGPTDPVEVIKWKEVYDIIEAAIDKCQDAAKSIESILSKHGGMLWAKNQKE